MTQLTLAFCLLLAFAPAPDPSYKLVSAAGNTYGYDIYVNGRVLIHQLTIPGLPGNLGFRRKKDAEKVAGLVIHKLEQHVMPPAVSRAELDSLHIKF
jgi:hypothetical protein